MVKPFQLQSVKEDKCFFEQLKTSNRCKILDNQCILVSKEGIQRLVHITAISICRPNQVNEIVLYLNDVSDYFLTRKAVDYLSKRDPLTNLCNRRYINEKLRNLTEDQLPATIMVGYIHELDLVCSAFGDETETELVRKMAQIIGSCCSKETTVARWGGNAFLVLMPNTNKIEARINAVKIIKQCEMTTFQSVPLLLSLGIAVKETMTQNTGEIITKANSELLRTKLRKNADNRSLAIRSVIDGFYKRLQLEGQHCIRVARICSQFAKGTGLSSQEIRDLWIGGLYHDVGKIFIKQSILEKPGRLTSDEYRMVKLHSEAGYGLLANIDGMETIARYILSHHERWDGKGYPLGIGGREIPLQSRIIAVADAFDAMTNLRPYKDTLSLDEAVKELQANAGTQFDPNIVSCFVQVLPSIIKNFSIKRREENYEQKGGFN